MPRTREYSAKEVADALREANGVVRQAATKLGCTPKTVYRYADEYVTVEQAMQEARQDLAGEAEGYLVAMMRDREHPKHYKAVKDVLRNYHPDDWSDKKKELEHGGPDGEPITIEVVNSPDED